MKLALVLPLVAFANVALAQWQVSKNPTYFTEVGRMVVEIKGIRWTVEICSELVPETASENARAYELWLQRHRAFVEEMENQFSVMEAYWQTLPPKARAGAPTRDQFNSMVNSQREPIRQRFLSKDKSTLRRGCEAYPSALATEPYDLPVSRAERVAIIRRGPR
jgi:hypothetical protein